MVFQSFLKNTLCCDFIFRYVLNVKYFTNQIGVSKNVCEQRGNLAGSNGAIMSLDHDAGGSLLLASSTDFASRVWSIDDQRLRHTLTGHSNKVLAAKFLGDSNKVVSASYDRTIKVWILIMLLYLSTIF